MLALPANFWELLAVVDAEVGALCRAFNSSLKRLETADDFCELMEDMSCHIRALSDLFALGRRA